MNIKKSEPDNMKIPFFSRKGKHEHKTLKEGKTITDIRCDSIHSPVLQKKFNRITCLLPVFKSPHRLSVCLHLSKSRLFHFPDTIMVRVSMSMAGPVLVSLYQSVARLEEKDTAPDEKKKRSAGNATPASNRSSMLLPANGQPPPPATPPDGFVRAW